MLTQHNHISEQFDNELETVLNHLMTMGGLVETQVRDACRSLLDEDLTLAEKVVEGDAPINDLDVSIHDQCTHIIARRHPAASDLRLVISLIKTAADLERIGDEAEKIGRMAKENIGLDVTKSFYSQLTHLGEHVRKMLHDALDALARMDVEAAIKVVAEDEKVDKEYEAIMRILITLMMEDSRSIRRGLNTIWSARALERIGDHAKNIGETIVYLVKGKDVRHSSLEDIRKEALEPR